MRFRRTTSVRMVLRDRGAKQVDKKGSQEVPYPLIREYSLNHIMDPSHDLRYAIFPD